MKNKRHKINAAQVKLYKTIDEILWFDWDPIGINQEGIRDEYYGYVPEIYQLKVSGSSKLEIAKHLDKIITEKMGMKSDMSHNMQIAEKIFTL